MHDVPETRYATSEDVHIAYQIVGRATPLRQRSGWAIGSGDSFSTAMITPPDLTWRNSRPEGRPRTLAAVRIAGLTEAAASPAQPRSLAGACSVIDQP